MTIDPGYSMDKRCRFVTEKILEKLDTYPHYTISRRWILVYVFDNDYMLEPEGMSYLRGWCERQNILMVEDKVNEVVEAVMFTRNKFKLVELWSET